MKKTLSILLSWISGLVVVLLILLIPIFMIMDFFGANITDGYIENNSEYAEQYKSVLNKNLKANNGYVSLERILYFYLADNSLSFEQIYSDNIDKETKKQLPIGEVCLLERYKVLNVCGNDEIEESGQINQEQAKPFAPPINFTTSTVTSIFMEERVILGKEDIHNAWDIANISQTPVYSTCDGKVELVSFPYSTNENDIKDTQGGNIIKIRCDVEELQYMVLYAHLYPNSSKISTGDIVSKGQIIASIGQTGYAFGDHLHYQVTLNGKLVDGISLIDFSYEENEQENKPSLPLKPSFSNSYNPVN